MKVPEWVLHAIKTVYYCEITHVCPLLVTLSNDMLFTHIIIKYWLQKLSQRVMQVLMDGQLSVLSSSKSSSNGGRYSNLRFVAELFVGVVVAGVVAELVAGVVPPVDVLGSGETGSM